MLIPTAALALLGLGAGLAGVIQGFQSGVVNDSVTWLVAGLACIGGVLALIMH